MCISNKINYVQHIGERILIFKQNNIEFVFATILLFDVCNI